MKQITMLLTNDFNPDPRVYKEALYLTKQGAHVTILCWDRESESDCAEYEIQDGIEVVRYKFPSIAGSGMKQLGSALKYIIACKKYLNNNHCDFLHCNDLDGAIIGWLTRKGITPMVFDMHEVYDGYYIGKPSIMRKITKFFIRKSVAALYENDVYLSDSYKEVHDKLYKLKNYPDSGLIETKPKSKSNIFRIGYHGAVRGQIKEFKALFDAVKDMSEEIRVDINGNGPDLKELKELEKSCCNVFIHGAFDGTKMLSNLYEGTDLLFCGYAPDNPNQQETAEPVKYFEAILTGTPMLATEALSIGKKVTENGFGLACDTRNPNAIRDAILKIKEDKALWQKFHENELVVAHKYDWQEEVKVLDKVYNL